MTTAPALHAPVPQRPIIRQRRSYLADQGSEANASTATVLDIRLPTVPRKGVPCPTCSRNHQNHHANGTLVSAVEP